MIDALLKTPSPFLPRKRPHNLPVVVLNEALFKTWIKKQKAPVKNAASDADFKGQPRRTLILRDAKGSAEMLVTGVGAPMSLYDLSFTVAALRSQLSAALLKEASFTLEFVQSAGKDIEKAHIGWALGCYKFDLYKKDTAAHPALVWSKGADKDHVQSVVSSLCILRNLINTPANDLGPEALEQAARRIVKPFDAKVKVVVGEKLLSENFPLIHAVGQAGHEAPRLIDISWGKKTDPKVTLVGKGVTFDTGGLNIKPAQYMKLMKKDMGGAAHVLALGKMIMEAGLPVNLRIIVPVVENAISASAFRPGDILKSRKGLTVENTNTDAEGRLILADALAYACEDNPDIVIDYATLTGSARAALGPDIPAFFATSEKTGASLQKMGEKLEDPVWQMPLWEPYKKHNLSPVADLMNSSSVPGDLIFSALFLKSFVAKNIEWIHLDTYAWEHSGFAGRPAGGADTGLRAIFGLLEDRYGR
jgi:leucyl aminopeptidase